MVIVRASDRNAERVSELLLQRGGEIRQSRNQGDLKIGFPALKMTMRILTAVFLISLPFLLGIFLMVVE
jgi:hypothetical protein